METTWKDRVKILLKKQRMTQTDLATKLNVNKATVSVWLGQNLDLTDKNTRKLQYEIAAVLEVDPQLIIDGNNSLLTEIEVGRMVPLLQNSELSTWLFSNKVSETVGYRSCPVECGERTFCYVATSTSMDSSGLLVTSYPHGSLVYIDPDLPMEIGQVCLFQDKAPVLGAYEEINGLSVLAFHNPRFSTLNVIKDNYIGQAIGCFQKAMKTQQYNF